jgi:hypothetical protein
MDEPKKKAGRPVGTAGIKKRTPNLKPRIQGHILRAIKGLELGKKEQGTKGLTELLMEAFREDVLGTLSLTSKYLPRELNVTKNETHTHEYRAISLDETLKQLHDVAGDAAERIEAAAPEKPLLN